MPNPTIVLASLDDEKLKQSIANLVAHVKRATHTMLTDTNSTVDAMEKKIKSLGNLKIDSGGSADGGASKRAKAQNAETDAIEKSIVARDKQIKKNQEVSMSFDRMANAQQVAIRSANPSGIRNADTLQTMNIQLDLLRERLREARQQYSSFVALAAHATTTGDKGLFQYATEGVHRYEQEVRSLIPQIRTLQSGIRQMGDVIAPQGHTIQNYVNSLQKANPELAALNAQYKSGTSLLQGQSTSYASATQSAQRYTEELKKQAAEIRKMPEWKQGRDIRVPTPSGWDAVVNSQKKLSLEEQLLKIYQMEEGTLGQLVRLEQSSELESKEKLGTEKQITQEIEKQKKAYVKPMGVTRSAATSDMLRGFMASKLGVDINKIQNFDTTNASAKQLNELLKQLKDTYSKLTLAERNSPFGVTLLRNMQAVQRQSQQLNAQLSRPVSLKDVLSASEKTLDDIAYKMQRLSLYRSGLNVETQKKEIGQVNAEYNRLKKKMDEVMQKNQNLIASNTALGRSWNYMKNRLAFYFTVGASTQFVKNLIEVRSQYEMNERALGILIDSAERGTQIFNELSQMALVSPYTLIELSTAAKQLTAYDVAAKDVVDTTRRLADMAAAVGIPIERLTYALGQIKAYGYLNSRDARMFANAGIPLVKQLSEYYTELEGRLVSTADVYDRIKKKSIDYNEVMEVMYKMTDEGGKFFDFQAKMADTLKVRLANLTLAWNNMLNDIGKSQQGVLTTGIGLLKDLFLRWKDIDTAINGLAKAYGVAAVATFLYLAAIKKVGVEMALQTVIGKKLSSVIVGITRSLWTLITSPVTWWTVLAAAIGSAVIALAEGNKEMVEFNKNLREGAKTSFDEITKFLEQYKTLRESLYDTRKVISVDGKESVTATPKSIDETEAKKAWVAVREQIELSTSASDEYIQRLLTIEDTSERLRQAFNILDDVKAVSAALKEIGDDGIKVTRDWSAWWNIWAAPDGLIQNLKDYQKQLDKISDEWGNVADAIELVNNAAKVNAEGGIGQVSDDMKKDVRKLESDLAKFRKDLDETTQSIIDFINLKGWSGDVNKINQVFGQATSKLITEKQLNPQEAFTLQLEIEQAKTDAVKQAYEIRIADENSALENARDENARKDIQSRLDTLKQEQKLFLSTTATERVYWKDFTKFLKEQHMSEMTEMFRGMDSEQIKSLNFQEGEYNEWVKRMVDSYAKSHKMSYDDAFNYLKSWVLEANTWETFIKLTISTERDKSLYETLKEGDSRLKQIDDEIDRLKKVNAGSKDYADAQEEITKLEAERKKLRQEGAIDEKKDRKDAAAARKAAKEAESELAKALKEELSTIDKVRSIYKDLTKEGMSHANAVERATRGWDETVSAINKVLQKNGLQKLDLSKFVGIENPRELVNMLQSQLNELVSRGAKPAEIKELQTKTNTLEVEADKYDLTMITKGLNNELGKLKEEYELAVELDANPELGGIFADMMGLDKEQLAQMPRDFNAVVVRMQKIIDDKLGVGKFNLVGNLNKSVFESWLKANQQGTPEDDAIAKSLESIIDYVNKIRLDSSKKQIEEWNKLLEKYAEYEYKRTQIQKEAEREREVARKKGANQNIINAINNREKQRYAQLDFEEFQKSSYWITATGDLANLSRSAIDILIQRLNAAKKSFKNLDAKQIKQLNSALSKLYKEQRKNNPFKAIGDMLQESRERVADFQREITETEQKIQRIEILKGMGDATEEQIKSLPKLIDRLKELKDAQKTVGNIDASQWVGAINETVGAVKAAVGVFDDLAKAIGGVNNSDLDKAFSVIDKAGQGAAIGAQIGGGYGAIIGAVAGAASELISIFAGAENERITDKIKESEYHVKQLELTYVDLQHAIDKAYGMATIGAKRATIANKELQLSELKRQLALEQSRSSKDRDRDRIIEIQKQIKELEYDIKDSTDEIVNDLLGVSSVGDALESVMTNIIDTFRNGSHTLKDIMKDVKTSFNDMIANMVMKMYTTKILQPWFEKQWGIIQNDIEKRIPKRTITTITGEEKEIFLDDLIEQYKELLDYVKNAYGGNQHFEVKGLEVSKEEYISYIEELIKDLEEELQSSMTPTKDDIKRYTELLRIGQPIVEENLKDIESFLRELGLFNDKKQTTLSALQAGISGITEDTAGAIEAYLNGVSQQVYLHSDLLTQIRDAVVGFDMDVQVATQAQMLLQLQQSYAVQMAIQGILEGWNNPSGQAVRVELVS